LWLGPGVPLPLERGAPYRTDDGITGEIRSFHPLDRVRLTWRPSGWGHDSTVQVTVRSSGPKTALRFHQERLSGPEERAAQHEYWQAKMDRVAEALAAATR
ncbi:SRPBCC domain-containing protein, partial [Amycolatopsis rhizosphaerae]